MFVCLWICPHAYLRNGMSKLHQIRLRSKSDSYDCLQTGCSSCCLSRKITKLLFCSNKYSCLMAILLMWNSGIPDSPLYCTLQGVANTTAVIRCYRGYNGGQDVSYVVIKAGRVFAICYIFIYRVWLRGDKTVHIKASSISYTQQDNRACCPRHPLHERIV